jgi:undecaprenyl-diphosphatase
LRYYYLLSSIVTLTVFVILAILVSPRVNGSANSQITKQDYIGFLKISNSHYHALNEFMVIMSKYGREVVWSLTIILLFVFGGWTGKKAAIIMALAMLVIVSIGTAAKDIVARPRPVIPRVDFLVAADREYAFPSGHAMIVSAGAATVLALFRDSPRKLAISLTLAVEAALVCFSRVYVGGHYPLDVVGGILLGVGISFIFVAEERYVEQLLVRIKKIVKPQSAKKYNYRR